MSELESAADSPVELICPYCGYNLAAIESPRCPECGNLIDRSTLGRSVLPWLHRQHLGNLRAFWQTVMLVTFKPDKLATEMNCPARLSDAVRFRQIVTLHLLIPAIAVLALGYDNFVRVGGARVSTDKLGSILQIATLFVGIFCSGIFFYGATGAASFFFHASSLSIVRQNRAIAISHYSCGPMAFLPLGVLCAVFAVALFETRGPVNMPVLLVIVIWAICAFIAGLSLFALLRVPIILLQKLTHCGIGRQLTLAVLLPLIWLSWAGISLGILIGAWLAIVIMAITVWS